MPCVLKVKHGFLVYFKNNAGKISAQPHTTLSIQFLDRENNDKKQCIAIGKTDLFYNVMGLCGNLTNNAY